MSDDRPPVYYDPYPKLIIRASAIGNPCLLEHAAAGQDHPPKSLPRTLVKAFDDGTNLEPVVVSMMEKEGVEFVSHQEEGELLLDDNVVVRYHPDGIAWLNSQFLLAYPQVAKQLLHYKEREVVVEIKALSNALWQTFVKHGMQKVIDEYPWQLSSMMIDTGLPGLWAGYNKGNSDGSECKDKGRIHYQYVPTPIINFERLRIRANQIKEVVEGEDILTSGLECNALNHWPCRYIHLRPQVEAKTNVVGESNTSTSDLDIGDESKDRYDDLVKQYQFYKGQEDESKERREQARDAIIELAGKRKVKVRSDKWEVGVYEGHGSKGYDWARMPDELKEELKKYEQPGKRYYYIKNVKRLD